MTLMRWVGEKMAALPTFTDTLLPAENGDALELDELWSFVQSKTQTLWLWVALCRRTRQIVAYTLGDRSTQSAADLRADLPKDYRGHPRAATSGMPTPLLSRPGLIAAAAPKPREKPATSSVGLAPNVPA